MVKEQSFRDFCSEEPYSSMSTSQAWELYLIKVKGRIQSELNDYCEQKVLEGMKDVDRRGQN
jgi:hypothetical protein